MFGGGGGINPRKMQQMMEQMGIDMDEIDATEVIIRTEEEELYFEEPDVNRMDARGQSTYQILGEPVVRERGESDAADADDADDESDGGADIPDTDVEIVAQRTDTSKAEARRALEEADGDLAAAVSELE